MLDIDPDVYIGPGLLNLRPYALFELPHPGVMLIGCAWPSCIGWDHVYKRGLHNDSVMR